MFSSDGKAARFHHTLESLPVLSHTVTELVMLSRLTSVEVAEDVLSLLKKSSLCWWVWSDQLSSSLM